MFFSVVSRPIYVRIDVPFAFFFQFPLPLFPSLFLSYVLVLLPLSAGTSSEFTSCSCKATPRPFSRPPLSIFFSLPKPHQTFSLASAELVSDTPCPPGVVRVPAKSQLASTRLFLSRVLTRSNGRGSSRVFLAAGTTTRCKKLASSSTFRLFLLSFVFLLVLDRFPFATLPPSWVSTAAVHVRSTCVLLSSVTTAGLLGGIVFAPAN